MLRREGQGTRRVVLGGKVRMPDGIGTRNR